MVEYEFDNTNNIEVNKNIDPHCWTEYGPTIFPSIIVGVLRKKPIGCWIQ